MKQTHAHPSALAGSRHFVADPRRWRGCPARALIWKNGRLDILDQRLLPHRVRYIPCRNHLQAARCIKEMAIRGAPAIGDAAAYGVALAAKEIRFRDLRRMKTYLKKACGILSKTRPTAVNLFWALERMRQLIQRFRGPLSDLAGALEREAQKIYDEDLSGNRRIGDFGSRLLPAKSVVLTHCNAGALATAGYGTATGILYRAHEQGKIKKVFVDETRPYLQGSRLTAWELMQANVPCELITDSMAGHFMNVGGITAVVVGADRIAANGDVANKIGTYSLAILARHHKIPFYVAAPTSTLDLKTPTGKKIPIEERNHAEVTSLGGVSTAPKGVVARHPAFDVTPNALVSAIITEKGVARAPYRKSLKGFFP